MSLAPEDLALFAALADDLIPAEDGMPSASQADVAGPWLARVLAACPERREGLIGLLRQARGVPPAAFLSSLRAQDAAAFGALAETVAAAYFMNPVVRQAIGYAGQTAQPLDPRADYMEDGLLESVIRRGPLYRPTPPAGAAPVT